MAREMADLPVGYVKLVIGYKTSDGIKEVVQEVNETDFDIASLNFSTEKKFKQTKDEDGLALGFEPTGEFSWTLKLKYVKPE